jgi:hypothetical protein
MVCTTLWGAYNNHLFCNKLRVWKSYLIFSQSLIILIYIILNIATVPKLRVQKLTEPNFNNRPQNILIRTGGLKSCNQLNKLQFITNGLNYNYVSKCYPWDLKSRFLNLYLAVLGFELRALCLLHKHSTTWVKSPVLFALVIFQIRSCVFAWTRLDLDPIYASCVAGKTGTCYHAQFTCWDGILLTFSWGWL